MNGGVRVSLSQAFVLPGIKCEGICGSARTGCLHYTILPIQEAVDHSYERQMVKLEEVTERQRVAEELQKQGRVRPCEPLCAALPGAARTDTGQAYSNGFGSPFES